jgi:hypothetical protein
MTQIRPFMPELLTACGRGAHPGDRAILLAMMKSNGRLDAVGRPPLAIVPLLVRPEARLPHLPD